jgi:hypothetical protein
MGGIRIAEILAAGAERYLATHRVPHVAVKACAAIRHCRTGLLGTHARFCTQGHLVGVWYNACRNRSCPSCAFYRVQRWLERVVTRLLGCAHHHLIFTIPHELNFLWTLNYVVMGELLFHAARDALLELARDAQHLGATPGVVMALHTWGQQLPMHPHLHCLATAGGVDQDGNWVQPRRRSFLPAEPLKQLFRGKFIYRLRGLARQGRLRLPDGCDGAGVDCLCRELRHKRWNVRICERYEDPTRVLNYLGRYLHGGPIGQSRLLAFDGHTVTFRYKDYRDIGPDGPRLKPLSLPTDEFIRRLLQHVPPKRFHMVRGFGLYRRGGSTAALHERVRQALPIQPEVHAALASPFASSPGKNDVPGNCPACGSALYLVVYTPRGKGVHRVVYPPRGSPIAAAA